MMQQTDIIIGQVFVGDIIVAINGENVHGYSLAQVHVIYAYTQQNKYTHTHN